MKRLLSKLSSIGLGSSPDDGPPLTPTEERFVRVTNITLAIAVGAALAYCVLSGIFLLSAEYTGGFLFLRTGPPPPGFFSLTLVNLLFLGIYSLIYIPMRLRGFTAAKIALFISVVGHIACTAVFMGPGSGVELYLLIIAFFPFMVLSRRERPLIIGSLVALPMAYIMVRYSHTRIPPLAFPRETIRAGYYMNVAAMFLIVVALSAYHLTANAHVEEKLELERGRSDRLLLNVLPESIAGRLKQSETTIADSFENTSVLFADLVGFTELSQRVTPRELLVLLNEIFSAFDDLAEKYGLEKIKTIGDAYMVAAGLPGQRPDHAAALANMALDMRAYMMDFRIMDFDELSGGRESNSSPPPLAIRIGINSGPVVAGVIGKKKFIYDLWGDSVNTAARMESHGLPGEIQVTESTHRLLGNDYDFESRGEIQVKGKGVMRTYLLLNRRSV